MAEDGGERLATSAHIRTPDVFISYASQDTVVATTVVEALERGGVACWIAPRDVTPGTFYANEIVHAIDASKAIVLILSKNAADSQHVLREVERAASKRHPVVSLRIDQASLPAGLEYFLNTSQWLDASGGDVARSMSKLIAAIRIAVQAPVVMPQAAPTPRAPAPPTSARSSKLTAIIVMSLIGLTITAFAIGRLWVSSRNAAPALVPTAAVSTPVPAAAPPTIPEKSVAVLPFVDMSEKKDQEYFSDGLSEELIDVLTKVPDLRVPARTSSFYFKGRAATIADIAKTLRVLYVLEGSVRKSGKTLRVTAQLSRADNGYHVWSETYDRQVDDVFKVQDEITRAVVKELKVSLLGGSMPESTGTRNIEAYNLYLQGRAIFDHATKRTDYELVVEYLHKALIVDPKFANAWALLAGVRCAENAAGYAPPDLSKKEARHAAKQALMLNAALPEAHVSLARVLREYDFDIRGAEAQARQALELDPKNSRALASSGTQATISGQFDTAIQLLKKAIDADPVNPSWYDQLSSILYFAGKYSEALAANRKMLDLNPGARGNYYYLEGLVSLAKGDPSAALAEMESDKELRENCGCLALAYDALGRKNEADAALANLEKNHADESAYEIACVYANRGELDQTFKWFERAYRQREASLLWIKVDPLVKNVQSDPRYNALLRKMNMPV